MSPNEHLDWFADNIAWFCEITAAQTTAAVPACPGWDVAQVLTHLAFGLGRSYPHAFDAPIDGTADDAFANVQRPLEPVTGQAAIDAFATELTSCLDLYRGTDPATPCWTYAGPGVAAFWFRRAAIETTLHAFDVADALKQTEISLAADRATDAIDEAVSFALPMATTIVGTSPQAIEIRDTTTGSVFRLGQGPTAATVSGPAKDLVAELWGRSTNKVAIDGDTEAAKAWLGLVEAAFAGR